MNTDCTEAITSYEICKEYYDKPTNKNIKKINFAFTQAEKELEASTMIRGIIESKATQLGAYLVPILTVSAGVCYTTIFNANSFMHRPSIYISLSISIIFILLILDKLFKVLSIKEYYLTGNEPGHLLNDKNDKTCYHLKVCEVMHYNDYIKHNNRNNSEKAALLHDAYSKLRITLCFSLASPILLEVVFWFLTCYCQLHGSAIWVLFY